jgi:hypothetical protein
VPKVTRWEMLKNKAILPSATLLWENDTIEQEVKLHSVS